MIQFMIDRDADPERSKLRDALEGQFAYERMRAARSWFAHLLAVLGVVIWLEAIWPDLLSSDIRVFTLAVFGAVLFLVVRVTLAEYVSHHKWKRCFASQHGLAFQKPEELS